MIRWLMAVLLTLISAQAQAVELRKFVLDDGRIIYGEVKRSETEGMAVWTPQGEAFVAYDHLVDMSEIDLATFREQPDWLVFATGPRDVLGELGRAFVEMEGMAPFNARKIMGERGMEAVDACEMYGSCLTRLLDLDPWMWVIIVREEGDDTLVLEGWIGGNTKAPVTTLRADRAEGAIKTALYRVMGLKPLPPEGRQLIDSLQGRDRAAEAAAPSPAEEGEAVATVAPAPVVEAPPPLPPRFTPAQAHALAWIPLPGMPSLAAGDAGGMALSWAVAVPTGTAWVFAAGATAAHERDHVIMSIIGCYATTVAVNHLISAPRASTRPAVAVGLGPNRRGDGATLTVAGAF